MLGLRLVALQFLQLNRLLLMPSCDPISNFLRTDPSVETIVHQNRIPLYRYPKQESLYAATHTYLDHIENVLVAHWHNGTSEDQEQQKYYTTGLKVTEGKEFSKSINLSATFRGLSVGTSEDEKTFSETETTSSEAKTLTVTVAANSDLFFYQRKYVFRTKMTWVLDSEDKLWNVGSRGGRHIQEGSCVTEICAADYITSEKELEDTSNLKFVTLEYTSEVADATITWEETTSQCRSTLEGIGINGSQR